MNHSDTAGLVFSTSSERAVVQLQTALTAYLAARTDTMQHVDAALVEDPDMPMAVCFRGYLLRLAAHPAMHAPLQASLKQAKALADHGVTNTREQLHINALVAWCEDNTTEAAACLEEILVDHPSDMLALRIAHYLHFYAGDGDAMAASTGRVLSRWSEDHPHYHYLLGMHAFGLEESGDYGAALEAGRAATQANPADIWATHAVSHVYQMQGEHAAGLAWIDEHREHWHELNNFRYHVIWHGALHHLGQGEHEAALSVYDDQLADSIDDDFYLDVCNNAALLLRLEFLGVDVGTRWENLVACCRRHAQDKELLFATLHYLMPLAATGDTHSQTLLDTLAHWAEGDTDQARLCRRVGLPLAQAVACSRSSPAQAAKTLSGLAQDLYQIGGSKAQREVFTLLAQDAAKRGSAAAGLC